VIDLERDIIGRLAVRAGIDHQYVEDVAAALERLSHRDDDGERVLLGEGQVAAVRAITGTGPLVLIEGAAGVGKTTVLSTAKRSSPTTATR
jgi:nucleoside-diphosphate-sugar epimerase